MIYQKKDLDVSIFVHPHPELKNEFQNNCPVFIMGKTVLAISATAFNSFEDKDQILTISVGDVYDRKTDLMLLNSAKGNATCYHLIRDAFKSDEILKYGFDSTELDFMYKLNLADERYDIKVIESDAIVTKREQTFSIKCKTREESILLRQYFNTTDNEIDYDKFYKTITKSASSLNALLGEDENIIPVEKLIKCETSFKIKYGNETELKYILSVFKLSEKKKVIRASYKSIKEYLK